MNFSFLFTIIYSFSNIDGSSYPGSNIMKTPKQEKIDLKEKSKEENVEIYTSLIDEFRRQKIVYNTKRINGDSIDVI
jgi:hypothetical protein